MMNGGGEILRIHEADTVAVAVHPLKKGGRIEAGGVVIQEILEDIPPGHKIALKPLAAGERVIKYGCPIGAASQAIPAGAWVHTHNLRTLLSETPRYHYRPFKKDFSDGASPAAELPGIDVFRRADGQAGIRNELWIIPTVGCVNRTAEALARWGDAAFSGGVIDGVYAWPHPYGCSQMGNDHEATRTILANLAKHPNAGAVLIVSLGCENNTAAAFQSALGPYAADRSRIAFLSTQEAEDEIAEGRRLLTALAAHAEQARREPAGFSELIVGMKCGGSDGFSGVTANALTGKACDILADAGASVILTEVPEMFGAEQMLMDRCESRDLFDKTVSLIEDFKEYYRSHNQVVYENPSPGNKAGGITTLEEKSCGCVQKGGTAPVRGVYRYGDYIPQESGRRKGLVLLEGPGNDIVSTTGMTAAGAQIILFTTGRGTPLGAPVPTLKIASNTGLAGKKAGWIDFDAGPVLEFGTDMLCPDLLRLIADVASGRKKTKNEVNGYREIAIFKNGVTL
ncbi:MAG: altronate dehydratase family protein [Spirochaetaceae bacterium]|jgi:altronate hydrolase|nr:altronate dehydratase family protein [Spirochaetaceae bacterium]